MATKLVASLESLRNGNDMNEVLQRGAGLVAALVEGGKIAAEEMGMVLQSVAGLTAQQVSSIGLGVALLLAVACCCCVVNSIVGTCFAPCMGRGARYQRAPMAPGGQRRRRRVLTHEDSSDEEY